MQKAKPSVKYTVYNNTLKSCETFNPERYKFMKKSVKFRAAALGASLLMAFSAVNSASGVTYDADTTLTSSPAWGENVQINSGVTVTLGANVLPGQTADITVNIDGTLSLNNTNTGNHDSNNSLTNAANCSIAFTGSGTFIKTGAGNIAMLSGGYTSDTTGYGVKFALSDGALVDIQQGTLRNGGWANQNWGSNMADVQIASGAKLDLWDGTAPQFDALVGAGTVTTGQVQARTLKIGVANSTWLVGGVQTTPEFSGRIEDGSKTIGLNKVGTGTQILSGTYVATGGLTVSAGTLQIGNGTNGVITTSGNVSVASGAALTYNSAKISTISGVLSGAGNLNVEKGTLNLESNANTFTGTWKVSNGGILGISAKNFLTAATAGTSEAGAHILLNVNEADAAAFTGADFNTARATESFGTGVLVGVYTASGNTVSQSVAGDFLAVNQELYKSGAGTFALTGAKTDFTAAIHVAQGALSFGNGTLVGSVGDASEITVDSGSSFIYNNGAGTTTTVMNKITGDGSLVFASGTYNYTTASPAITTFVSPTASYGPAATRFGVPQVTIQNGAKVVFADGVTPTFSRTGTVTIEAGGVLEMNSTKGETHNYDNSVQYENNTLTINGAGTFVKTGAGSVAMLSRYDGHTGSVVVAQSAGGWIDIQQGVLVNGGWTSGVNWGNNKGSLNIASGARMNQWDNGYTIYVDNLTGAGVLERGSIVLGVANNTDSAAYGVTGNTATFAGIIRQFGTYTMNVTKRGTGTQIFTGANTYTGTTTVEAGTLQIGNGGATGKIGTGTVKMNGGTLLFKTQQENTVAGLGGTGTVSLVNSGKVNVSSGLNLYGTLNVESASDMIQFSHAANTGSCMQGNITGNGTVAFAMDATNQADLRFASVAETASISVNGGTVISGGNNFAGTLKVTENATVTLADNVAYKDAHPWNMTLYTDKNNSKGSNGRVAAGGTNYTETKTFGDAGNVYDMWQCANSSDKTSVANNWMTASYSSMAYRTMIEVTEDVSLDFAGKFDDTQGVWVIACDANGNIMDGTSWKTLLGYSSNCAMNSVTGVNLAKGYYLMDVRVCDQTGDRYADGGTKDASGKALGIGMRVTGDANYSAMNIDAATGVVGGSNGHIVAAAAYASGAQVWDNAKFDIADGKTLTFDNNSAAVTAVTLGATVTGTGTLSITDSANSGAKFNVNLDSAGSVTTADGMKLALTGDIAGDLALGANSVLDFKISAADLNPVVTVGGTATLGANSTMNVLVTGTAPQGGDLLSLTLVETPDASKLVGFDSVDLNLVFEDPNLRMTSELVNGSYVLTLGNAASLPEPSAWALLVLGFGLVFLGKRRKTL